ncbi:hypothetical protein SAMN05660443_0266 [Marinospirillum celere]|uniref:Uncharacterized protein n=1 Tax=Marinospirillum celere TaxID=1122252 RepID=A0A1I1E1Q2_9GAMM|nr:hypothetical protein [Marinospirillum celere]SFB80997.1 hypothetical protein SAMN05660443_0266 [Marinospirillum celere]
MTTIRTSIQRLARNPGKTLDEPRKPEQISGSTALMTWPQENASGSTAGAAVGDPAEVFEGPLTEVDINERTYWPPTEIFDEEGVVSVEVSAIQSILAEDQNGNQTRIYLTNPYS